MSALIDGARIVDFILLLILAEALLLFVLQRRFALGPGLSKLVFTLAAGACLLMALRSALSDMNTFAIAAWLTAGFVAHILDVLLRWRSVG